MNDIVIDANVLVHTNNKNNHFNRSAIACGSNDKLLVSNDYDDFTDAIRQYVAHAFSVSILDSDEYVLTNQESPHG